MVAPVVLHRARHVLPISSGPIADGAVLVQGDTIIEVGRYDELRDRYDGAAVRQWDGVLTPGLVNAHTHLQYTSFDEVGASPYPDYTAWAVRFVAEYNARSDEDWLDVTQQGARLSLANGVTCIADVVTDWAARDVLHDLGIPGVAYLELLGTSLEEWTTSLERAVTDAIDAAPTTDVTRVGISPHAPYSVDDRVISASAELARTLGTRIHIHVGESDAEDDFYRTGTGALAERVRSVANRGVTILERGGTGMGTAEFVRSLGVLDDRCHIAHGVYLGTEGRRIMADAGTIVALCPRSNVTVGIDSPPVADYLHESVPFAVGTDSLGSSPSLDLLEDVQALRRLAIAGGYHERDTDRRLLIAATHHGAKAMGLDHRLGRLEPGMRADLAVFDPVPSGTGSVETDLVVGGPGRCLATIIGGVERYSAV